jgi:hypothetical protein
MTSCLDGNYNGWKTCCLRDAKDCVQNFILGGFPDMAFKAHEQYLKGYKAANDSGLVTRHSTNTLQMALAMPYLGTISKEAIGTWVVIFCHCVTLEWVLNYGY